MKEACHISCEFNKSDTEGYSLCDVTVALERQRRIFHTFDCWRLWGNTELQVVFPSLGTDGAVGVGLVRDLKSDDTVHPSLMPLWVQTWHWRRQTTMLSWAAACAAAAPPRCACQHFICCSSHTFQVKTALFTRGEKHKCVWGICDI